MCHSAPADWYTEEVYKAGSSLIYCLLVTSALLLDTNSSRPLCIYDPKYSIHPFDQIWNDFLENSHHHQKVSNKICARQIA